MHLRSIYILMILITIGVATAYSDVVSSRTPDMGWVWGTPQHEVPGWWSDEDGDGTNDTWNDPYWANDPQEYRFSMREWAEDFATHNLSPYDGLGGMSVSQFLTDIQDPVPADWGVINWRASSAEDGKSYAELAESKWNDAMNDFGDAYFSTAPANIQGIRDQLRTEYAQYVAEYIQGYATDIGAGTTLAYETHFNDLNSYFEEQVTNLMDGTYTSSDSVVFNPLEYLDKPVPFKQMQISVDYAGINDKFLTQNAVYIVEELFDVYESRYEGRNFAFYESLKSDVDFFTSTWGQAAELNTMDAPSWSGDSQMKWVGQDMFVSEYGAVETSADSTLDDVDEHGNAVNPVLAAYDLRDQRANNRSYGYSNGNFTTATLRIGNRKYMIHDNLYTSPLVLDLDGDGKLDASQGEWLPHKYKKDTRVAEFDIDGDNFIDVTEWVSPNDGLLIVYKEGQEIDANDLFGEAGGFKDGYEKLSLLDANGDKVISGDELQTLSIWQDKNMNAKVETGEVLPVSSWNIISISLKYDNSLVSSYTIKKGEELVQRKMWDWYPAMFRVKPQK